MVCNRAIAYKPLALGSNVGSISHFVTMQDPALKSRDYIPWDITHLSQYLGVQLGLFIGIIMVRTPQHGIYPC